MEKSRREDQCHCRRKHLATNQVFSKCQKNWPSYSIRFENPTDVPLTLPFRAYSIIVRKSMSQQSWVRSQRRPTQWDLRGRQMKQCWIKYINAKIAKEKRKSPWGWNTAKYCTVKKWENLEEVWEQSHRPMACLYMTKYLRISTYIMKPFLIYDSAPISLLNLLAREEHF